MRKKSWAIVLLTILAASALIGCDPAALTILSITEGDVSVMKSGTDSWVKAEEGMSLRAGDGIKTGDDSSAKITFSEGSTVELEASTEIEIASLAISTGTGPATIALEQTIGSVIFRVTKIVDAASRYEVETPTGVVAVRGSIMQVNVIEDGTTWATNLEGDIVAIAQGVELQVPEGRRCIISPGQPPELVIFTDPNLEAVIREAIGKPTGNIYSSDLEGLTSLNATARSITDLTGLERCSDLTYLDLWDNQISDISPLSNLISLVHLGIWDNRIGDISPLANLTSLEDLWLLNNQISDISPLSNITSLTVLWLGSNQISDISPLADLINLLQLELGENQITDISPLANLTSLIALELADNQISDISPLSNLASLTALNLRDNQIGDISPLSNLAKLTHLLVWDNQISDISPLSNLTNLTELGLYDNQISDISPLADLTNLIWLYLGDNQISDISPLANLASLIALNLRDNQISDISVLVDNTGLGEDDTIRLENNPLSSDSINTYIPQLRARGVIVEY